MPSSSSPRARRAGRSDTAIQAMMLGTGDFYRQPGYLIRRAHQIATAAFMARARRIGLTPVQYSSLIAIAEHPGIDATRVSAIVGFDRATLGQVIGRLEEKQFISREAGTTDKRTKLLRITSKGRQAIAATTRLTDVIAEDILKPLAAGDRAMLLKLLAQLVDSGPADGTEAALPKTARGQSGARTEASK